MDYKDIYSEDVLQNVRAGRLYYWIYYWYEGHLKLIGYDNTEDKAHERGMKFVEGPFEVIGLPTTDDAKATKMVRYKILEDRGPSVAERKIRHSDKVTTTSRGRAADDLTTPEVEL